MNYNEFIAISKENMNDITFEIYSKEIEPCYNAMPEINGDGNYSKADFIKWWKKNRNLCMWISGLVTALDKNSSWMMKQKKQIAELESKLNIMEEEKEAIMQEKEICISEREQIEQEYYNTKEVRERLDDENEKLYVALEKKNEQIQNMRNDAYDDRAKLLDKIAELQLKIAFTPDVIVREIRWEFFETYDEKKQDAIKRGIIKE